MINTPSARKEEVREAMRGGPGSVTIRHYFSPEDFGAKIRLCSQLIIPPGAGIGMHQHKDEDEIYLIRRGSGMLNDGKTMTRVREGDAVLTGKGESHAITNDGTTELEITAVIICYA
jgi:mannose-6-phosphate isomerase-like protein (cupin superfamily)